MKKIISTAIFIDLITLIMLVFILTLHSIEIERIDNQLIRNFILANTRLEELENKVETLERKMEAAESDILAAFDDINRIRDITDKME